MSWNLKNIIPKTTYQKVRLSYGLPNDLFRVCADYCFCKWYFLSRWIQIFLQMQMQFLYIYIKFSIDIYSIYLYIIRWIEVKRIFSKKLKPTSPRGIKIPKYFHRPLWYISVYVFFLKIINSFFWERVFCRTSHREKHNT